MERFFGLVLAFGFVSFIIYLTVRLIDWAFL